MKPFIYHERNGIYIIDLHATLRLVEAAAEFVRGVAAQGGTVLFVCTKRQGQESVREAAEKCGMPYVTQRWLGGMLTNWQTMRKRIAYLQELTDAKERGEWSRLTKKEALRLDREREKLEASLGGIKNMAGTQRGFHRGHQARGNRGGRSQQVRDPDRCGYRHQLRPRTDRLPHSGER